MSTGAIYVVASVALSVLGYYWGKSGKLPNVQIVVYLIILMAGFADALPLWADYPANGLSKKETGQMVAITLLPYLIPFLCAFLGAEKNFSKKER